MFTLSRFLGTDWLAVHHILELRRALRSRDATEDARRAQASRLTLIQSGPPFENHSGNAPGPSLRRPGSAHDTSL